MHELPAGCCAQPVLSEERKKAHNKKNNLAINLSLRYYETATQNNTQDFPGYYFFSNIRN